MTTKRIGRPKGDGTYKMVGVYGTQYEIDLVLELTPRQRLDAMLDKMAMQAVEAEMTGDYADDRERMTEYTRYSPGLIFTASE